jgi:hypothetical protein
VIGDAPLCDGLSTLSTVGYLSCRQDGTICCDFVDGTDMERTNPPHPENCRLILHTANQYAATKRLRQLEQLDDVEPRQLERQRAAAASERWHNKSDFDVRTGQPSTFGRTHQLLASASRKFIQAEKRLAKEDHRALQCSLADSDNVDKQAWFRIMPGYATRVEGDRVRMGDSVILESVRMPGTYIHGDEAEAIEGDQFEVNIASEPTRFVIVPVAKYRDANQASHLVRGGSFVQIFQRESQSYMCRSHDGNVRMLHPAMQSLEATTANGDQDDVSRRADFTWEVEVPQMLWSGSAVRHSNDGRTMLFSLKDSMSGKFLHESDDGTCFFDDGDDTEEAQWSLQPFDEDTEEFLFDRTPFAIRNAKTKRVLHRSKQLAASTDDGTSYELVAVDEQSCTEEDLFTFRYLPDEWLRVFQEVSILMENFAAFAEDIKLASCRETATDAQSKSGTKPKAVVVAVARSISVKATSRPTPSTNIHRIYRTYLRPYRFMREEDVTLESPALSMLSEFLLPLTMSSDTDPLTRDGPLNVALQRLLTDFRLVPRIMSIIDDILTLVPSDEIVLKTHGQEYLLLIQYCFRLLKVLAKDNEHNSRILFAQLDRLIANLAQPFMVTGVVSEIFKSANLIRSCDPSVLQKSWSLAKQLRLATYIDFLCVLLSLDQTPIKANQDVCIEIIRTDLGKESTNAYKMGFNSDIWAHAAESRQSLANFDIRNPSRDPENEPKRLVQRVNLANAQAESHGYSDAEDEERELVYHVALVKLAALLCAGRHRTSIDFFLTQPHLQFRYQDVLKVMQMNETPDNARLAHAQLMLSLFVDREPYELHVPTQETRILSSVKIASLNLGHPKRVDPYKDLRTANGEPVLSPTEGFTDLKDAIVSILLEDTDADSTSTKPSVFVVDAARPDRNAFVCELIELSRLLLLYGIYDGGFKVNEYSDGVLKLGEEATDLAVSLLPVLDGRTDKTVAQNSCRFYMSQENRTVMRMKRSILQVFEILFGFRDSSRIERVLNVVHSDATKQNGATTIKLSEARTKLSMDAEKDFGEIRYTNPVADKDREASDSMVKLGHHEVVNTMDLGIATVDHARNAVAGFVKASAGRLADPLTMLRPTASLTEGLTQKVSEEKSQLARVALGELQVCVRILFCRRSTD